MFPDGSEVPSPHIARRTIMRDDAAAKDSPCCVKSRSSLGLMEGFPLIIPEMRHDPHCGQLSGFLLVFIIWLPGNTPPSLSQKRGDGIAVHGTLFVAGGGVVSV